MADVISMLQGVKQAEEEKGRLIAEAHKAAAARVREAERAAGEVEAEVRRRVAAEGERLRAEIDAKLRADLQKLEVWHARRRDELRAAAAKSGQGAFDKLCCWFAEEHG